MTSRQQPAERTTITPKRINIAAKRSMMISVTLQGCLGRAYSTRVNSYSIARFGRRLPGTNLLSVVLDRLPTYMMMSTVDPMRSIPGKDLAISLPVLLVSCVLGRPHAPILPLFTLVDLFVSRSLLANSSSRVFVRCPCVVLVFTMSSQA